MSKYSAKKLQKCSLENVTGVPRDSHEFAAADQLRSFLLTLIVTSGRRVLSPRPHDRGLQRVRGVRDVQESRQVRAVLEFGLGAVVQGVERTEKTQQRQPRRSEVLPVHEGRERWTGRREVRGRVRKLRDRATGSDSQAKSGDVGYLSGH